MGPSAGQERLVLMLSSGQRPRYRDDIIRAMALPHGGRLQFRYREKYVPDDTLRELCHNSLRGCQAVVAYLDASDQAADPKVVPCRFARVLDTEVEGDFAVIRFEVGDFVRIAEGVDAGSEAKKLLPQHASLPAWKNGQLTGHFLIALTGRFPGCVGQQSGKAWQAVVNSIGVCPDFADCPFFYQLRSVVEEGTNTKEVKLSEGKYSLKPHKTYRADVVHYTPPRTAGEQGRLWGRIEVNVRGNGVQPLTSQHLSVDSPYDVKRVYFRTTGEATKQYALLSFDRRLIGSNAEQETQHHDFELVLEVAGDWKRQLVVFVLIAVFLAAPRWFDMLQAGAWDWSSAVVNLVTAVVTAGLVVFGLRKVP